MTKSLYFYWKIVYNADKEKIKDKENAYDYYQ